jgi:hypothetical protein
MRDDLLVGGDAERREDVPLVPDVIDHVGVVVQGLIAVRP